MIATVPASSNAAASLVALVVSANGCIDPREVAELDRLHAFGRLDISRPRFLRLAEAALEEIGEELNRTHWLRLSHHSRLLDLQLAVRDPDLRLMVCRLAAAVITADGRVTGGERLVYSSLLGYWGISQDMVTHAIMCDGEGRPVRRT